MAGRDARAAGESIDVVARTFHTVGDVPHAEGETYAVTDRVLAETLRGIGFVSIEGWTEGAPPAAPVLTTLTPATAVVGAAAFTVSVQGTGFVAADVVTWNGAAVPTTFVSATELTAAIDAVAAAGDIAVTVGASNALTFTVTAA
jgi:hypothetical protein